MTEPHTLKQLGHDTCSTAQAAPVSRRRFLALSAAGLAAQWLTLPLRAMTPSVNGPLLKTEKPLSMGYLVGSNQLERLDLLPWEHDINDWQWQILPTSSLPTRNQSLTASTVKITVHGLYPHVSSADETCALPQTAQLLVHYNSQREGEHACAHHAWGMSQRPTLSVGHRVSIVAPVHPQLGLPLTMELEPSVTGVLQRVALQRSTRNRPLSRSASLGTDPGSQQPRLMRGIYFLGFADRAFDRATQTVRPGAPVPSRLHSLVISVEPVDTV